MFYLILTLLAPLCVNAQTGRINVSEVDTIRVELFGEHETKWAYVWAHDAPIRLIGQSGKMFFADTSLGMIKIERKGDLLYGSRGSAELFQLSLPVEIMSSFGLVRVQHPDLERRYFNGSIQLLATGRSSLRFINRVGIDDYVSSVVAGEMQFEDPTALRVQAIIARTYALWNLAKNGKKDYDLTDHTGSQVYIGEAIFKPRYRLASEATSGEILTWSNKLILATFFSTSGGTTTGNEHVWFGKPLPYLRPIVDGDASSESPHFEWQYSVSKTDLEREFGKGNAEAEVLERDESGRCTRISIGKSTMTGTRFRIKMIRGFGPLSLKSTLFSVINSADSVTFAGKGLGHGVGLSQWGALGLAKSGWNAEEILKFYYTGVEIVNYHLLDQMELELAE